MTTEQIAVPLSIVRVAVELWVDGRQVTSSAHAYAVAEGEMRAWNIFHAATVMIDGFQPEKTA